MKIFRERDSRAIVWDNYKAGVIDSTSNKIIIPIRFDELYERIEVFKHERGKPVQLPKLIGFACFTDEGEAVAYDIDGNIDEWREWEIPMVDTYDDIPDKPLSEIEEEITKRFSDGEERSTLLELLHQRIRLLNHDWHHTRENVMAISRINDMLNRAVKEALRMGEAAEKALSGNWSIRYEVYPEWNEGCFQNTLVELGMTSGIRDYSPCFDGWASNDRPGNWDFKSATLDDGDSWDEGGFSRPAYQDCYFVYPFQKLSNDNYALAFSDIITIKNFKINLLISKEASE